MISTTTLPALIGHLDRIGLRAYMDHTGGGVMVLRVERSTDPLGHGPFCYISGDDGEQPFATDVRTMLLGANYGPTATEASYGVGEQDYDLFTTVPARDGLLDAAAVRAAVQTMLDNAADAVTVLRRALNPSPDRGMIVAAVAMCTRCGEDFGPIPVWGPGTQHSVAHDECGGPGCGGTGHIDPTTLRLDRSHGDAHRTSPTRDRNATPTEHTVFVAFDVTATSRADAHRHTVDALTLTDHGAPTRVGDTLRAHGVESWWLIEADAKRYDGNDNGAGQVIFG
jgi:hypothetical protein